jgi:L-fuculose-phosphate aldolase
MLCERERELVVAYARRLRPDGLVVGTSGNLSIRADDLVVVTPSGVDYDALTPALVGVHRLDGTPVEAPLAPTSELPIHLGVYAHTQARAVAHTHSTSATVMATVAEELPAVHYLIAMFGGPVRVAAYATYGTPELADNVMRALEGRTGCLLGNHGALTIGESLEQAYTRAVYLEWLCDLYLRSCAHGQPRILPAEEISRVVGLLAGYGQAVPPPISDLA